MVKIVVKLKNCRIGTKNGVVKYKKKKKKKNTEPPHSRTKGPAAPAVLVHNTSKIIYKLYTPCINITNGIFYDKVLLHAELYCIILFFDVLYCTVLYY